MKTDFLLKWWYKGDDLTEIVKTSRHKDDPLDLSKGVIEEKVTAILNGPSFQRTWFKDTMKRAIKSTLKEVIRNEKAELIAKTVYKISKSFPKTPINIETALQLLENDEELNKLTVNELRFTILNCDTIAKYFFNEEIFKIEKIKKEGKKTVTVLKVNLNHLNKVSKAIDKKFEKAIARSLKVKTDFNREKIKEIDQSLASNLKKDLFENIDEDTINYILFHFPLSDISFISNVSFNRNFLFILTNPDYPGYTKKRGEDCSRLFERLGDKEIQEKLKILAKIEYDAPEPFGIFTEKEWKFIKLVK
jgi:hypothetical protein